MSDEPRTHTSRFGAILVALAIAGSAIGVVAWQLNSNKSAGLDTSGFDVSTAPESAPRPRPVPAAPAAPAATAAPQSGLGMTQKEEDMSVAGSAPPVKSAGYAGSTANPTDPRQAAALDVREAAIASEGFAKSFIRRMEAKHPSITQYGKDWAASPELSALRDQYWKDRDPLKFAYGLAKSGDFPKLIKKYANDPGVRDVITSGIKEAPPNLVGSIGSLAQNDGVVKNLVTSIITGAGLPVSIFGAFMTGADAKAPDPNQAVKDILNSGEVKKAMPVSLDRKR